MGSKWVDGQVVGKKRWARELYSLRVDAPVESFEAGQFARLALEVGGEVVFRPYSFVNAPDQRPLEFYFISLPDGMLTQRLVALEDGDSILMAPRASGFFTLSEVPQADHLWMLATGTAIGPFISILRTDEPWRRFERVILVHAVRHAEELAYQDDIRACREGHPDRFRMIPFVSREHTGYAIRDRIPAAIADGRLEQAAGLQLSPAHSQVMICGNPAMVRDTTEVLEARGLKKNKRKDPGHITIESYW